MSQDVFFQDQSEIHPKLNPPIYRWQEDMPGNHQPQLMPPELIWLNTKNNIWMEIPRYTGVMWGGMIFGGGITLATTFFIFFMSFVAIIDTIDSLGFGKDGCIILILFLLMNFSFVSMTFLFFKIYFSEPRDQPLRLNIKRQKIYTFDYKRIWWNPWCKWPTTVKAYNWADIHGEMRFSSDNYTGGFQLFASVCAPGTLNVIERFQIADGSPGQLHQLWSYLCLYMQGEPVPDEAVNKGRPDFWCPRRADRWPDEMEHESTTAPDGEARSLEHRNDSADNEQ